MAIPNCSKVVYPVAVWSLNHDDLPLWLVPIYCRYDQFAHACHSYRTWRETGKQGSIVLIGARMGRLTMSWSKLFWMVNCIPEDSANQVTISLRSVAIIFVIAAWMVCGVFWHKH
jgi:hypothetical protein